MATKLNKRAFEHAKNLISKGKCIQDEKDKWTNLQKMSMSEYGKWYLVIEDDEGENNKGHYKFPYGDFENVHRCGLLAAETRAGQYKHTDIENAVAHLHGMLDK
jgi:hypothetical protein